MSIRVGIFFGGPSREREISFAGGRTVYDNLNKSLFEAVPIFVDSHRNWYLLNWEFLYKGSIRDFFPPVAELPDTPNGFQVYQESLGPLSEPDFANQAKHIGERIRKFELNELIDVAFLALHGVYGEDGVLQAELDKLGMPYTGSGVKASQIGMDKAWQKELMAGLNFPTPPIEVITREEFLAADISLLFERCSQTIGWPLVIRPANQGSRIGVSIIKESAGVEGFEMAINRAFFRELLVLAEWQQRSAYEQLEYIRFLSDIRDGLGYPLDATHQDHRLTIYHPEDLLTYLQAKATADPNGIVALAAHNDEQRVILEGFIDGKEFSTIVLRTEDGGVVALPPTEIVKGTEVFDYRSKYLPGLSRKVTPIDLPTERIEAIRQETERLFTELGFGTYARIDGFHTAAGEIFLNDPNTTSGMLPASFFFHQAAEIGLNPSQFLTYILRMSLWERTQEGNEFAGRLMHDLDEAISKLSVGKQSKKQIAVLLGGSSFERHISVESGRNVFEKLSSSDKYAPLPIFLTSSTGLGNLIDAKHLANSQPGYALFRLPINLLLKDNADDIKDKILHFQDHEILTNIRKSCSAITQKYAGPNTVFAPQITNWDELANEVDGVFIALHGRPGEDGQVQMQLDARRLPYNGSGVSSSNLTINKYDTLQKIKAAGFTVADQYLGQKADFVANEPAFYAKIEARFAYPFIAKPVDDGCSSAVKLIHQRDELHAYCRLIFQATDLDESLARRELKLKAKEEFPVKEEILFEELITAQGAEKFLEITGGMLTTIHPNAGVGSTPLIFEVFEPSEALAGGEILSLEEKFLAGEGQNLTPARLYTAKHDYQHIAPQVKSDLQKVAELLGVAGYCRIDAFVRIFDDGRAETVVIEVNSLPGMTPATAIFHQAAVADYQPYQFIDRLLEFGFARQRLRDSQQVKEGVSPTKSPTAKSLTTPIMANEPTPFSESVETTVEENEIQTASPESKAKDPAWKQTLLAVKDFLLNPYFWRNLGVLVLGLLLCFFALRTWLNIYTNHGEGLALPKFEGKMIEEARRIAKDRGLKIEEVKGGFDYTREPGLVVMQHPPEGSQVKRNRTIYLTTLSDKAPMVPLPQMVGSYAYEQYTFKLDQLNILHEIKEQVYDPKQEENTILHFFYDDQKITDEDLRKGVKIPEGSTLDFVVTIRRTGNVNVPNVVCRRYSEAVFVISGSNLVIGEVYGDVANRDDAYIYKTEPAPGQILEENKPINIYLTDQRPDSCE